MEGQGQRLGERLVGTLTRRRRPTSPDPPWLEPDPQWLASSRAGGARRVVSGARVGLAGAGERGRSVGEREKRRGERDAPPRRSGEEGGLPRVRCFQLESGVGPTLIGTVKKSCATDSENTRVCVSISDRKNHICPVRLADKPWLKVLLADLL